MRGEVEISKVDNGTKIEIWADGEEYTIKMNWMYTPLQPWPELRSVWLGGDNDHRELVMYRDLRNIAYLLPPAACVWRILEAEGLIDIDNSSTTLNSLWWKQVEEAFKNA